MKSANAKWWIWGLFVCVVLIIWASVEQFAPPATELDRLVYSMREAQRAALALHLIRIAALSAIFLLFWQHIALWLGRRFALPSELLASKKWRVFAWYLAFEAVMVINFI